MENIESTGVHVYDSVYIIVTVSAEMELFFAWMCEYFSKYVNFYSLCLLFFCVS